MAATTIDEWFLGVAAGKRLDMRAIVTVVGEDKVGIIAAVSGILAAAHANIQDISQTVMRNIFTMTMLADISRINMSFEQLQNQLQQKGEEMGLNIRIQREDIFVSMNRI